MCGIILTYTKEPLTNKQVKRLESRIKHRGQDNSGLCTLVNDEYKVIKGKYLPKDIGFELGSLMGLGVRYATSGVDEARNWTPSVFEGHKNNIDLRDKLIAQDSLVVFLNGEIQSGWINDYLKSKSQKYLFESDNDTSRITGLIQHLTTHEGLNLFDASRKVLSNIEGAYSIIIMKGGEAVVARDPNGTRPLELLITDNAVCFSSETQVFDVFDLRYHLHKMEKNSNKTYPYNQGWRRVYPGEMVLINGEGAINGVTINGRAVNKPVYTNLHQCIFDLIYFANPSGYCFGIPVMKFRGRLGKYLSKVNEPVVSNSREDLISCPVPNSGRSAANGYSNYYNYKSRECLIPNLFSEELRSEGARTFIAPGQDKRERMVNSKFDVASYAVLGNEIINIDDSLVRSTTAPEILAVQLIKGAMKVHLKLTAPPIRHPCYYGIDIKKNIDLFAKDKTIDEIHEGIINKTNDAIERAGINDVSASKDNLSIEYIEPVNLIKCANSFYLEDFLNSRFSELPPEMINDLESKIFNQLNSDNLIYGLELKSAKSRVIKTLTNYFDSLKITYSRHDLKRAFYKSAQQKWCLACFLGNYHSCINDCSSCSACANNFNQSTFNKS